MPAPSPAPLDPLPDRNSAPGAVDRGIIMLKTGRSTTRLVSRHEIVAIVASENYCRVLFARRRLVRVRGTLQAWVALLPPADFMRVHRTAIVNLRAIVSIVPRDREVLLVSVRGVAAPLRARRALRRELEARLAGHLANPWT